MANRYLHVIYGFRDGERTEISRNDEVRRPMSLRQILEPLSLDGAGYPILELHRDCRLVERSDGRRGVSHEEHKDWQIDPLD